jgi:hypothetical protein
VPDSAVAQYIDALIYANNNHPINQSGICLSRLIFCAGIAISGQFEHSSPVCLKLDFFKVGFNRIIGID